MNQVSRLGSAVSVEGMPDTIELDSPEAMHDLQVFVKRADSVSDGVVRLRASQGVLRVTVCTFAPLGILDQAPTVLGMRILRTAESREHDLLLSGRALLDRFARLDKADVRLEIPPTRETAAWAGRDVPRDEWRRLASLETAVLNGVALAGIAEVAAALPDNPGELLVREVREQVWNRPLDIYPGLTSATAFTGHILGFFSRDEAATVYQSDRWLRLSTSVGHVLVFQRA